MAPRMSTWMPGVAVMLLTLPQQSLAWNAPHYQAIDIGSLSGLQMEPAAVDIHGDIVGAAFNDTSSEAFYYQHRSGSLTVLTSVGNSAFSNALAINDRDEIVGTSNFQAVIWYPNGGQKMLGPYPNGTPYGLTGVNDSGLVVGIAEINGFSDAVRFSRDEETMEALLPQHNTSSFASAISNSGFVVGGGPYAFVWRAGELVNLATLLPSGSIQSNATAVNNAGDVIGTFVTTHSPEHQDAFFFQRGKMHVLENPENSSANIWVDGINDSGEIVGELAVPGGDGAYLYIKGRFLRLSSLVTNMSSGFCILEAVAINNRHDVAARGCDGHVYLLVRQS